MWKRTCSFVALLFLWGSPFVCAGDLNDSYLRDRKYLRDQDWSKELLSEGKARSYKMRTERLYSSFEEKKNYGIATQNSELEFQKTIQSFGGQALGDVRNEQQSRQLNRAREGLVRTQLYRDATQTVKNNWYLANPAAVAAVAYSLYTGHEQQMRLSEETALRARVEARRQIGSLGLENSWAGNGGMDVAALANRQNAEDRLRLSYGRLVPLTEFRTHWAYGVDTTRLNTALSRNVAPHLDAVVDTTKALSAGAPGAKSNDLEHRVRLQYGLDF